MRILRTRNNRILNNDGSTMLETLLAFVVLAMIMAALFAMIKFSANLRMRAIDTNDVVVSFNEEIYKDTPNSAIVSSEEYLGKHDTARLPKTTMFILKYSDKTSDENMDVVSGSSSAYITEDYKENLTLRVPNIDATGYKSLDNRIGEEKLACPKALVFHYNKEPMPTND